MKKLFLLLVCCTQIALAQPFKLRGKIAQPRLPYIVFSNRDPFSGRIQKDTIKLNNEGTFNHQIDIRKGDFALINLAVDSLRETSFYGYSGGELNIEFSATNQPLFSGIMAKIQDFAALDLAFWKNIYALYAKRNPSFEKKEFLRTDAYFKIQDSITSDRINNLKAHFKPAKNKFETAFLKYKERAFIYSDLYYKQSYPNAPFQKFKFYQKQFSAKSTYTYTYSDQVSFSDSTLFSNEAYIRFVNSFLISELYNRRQKNNVEFSWSEMINSSFNLIEELTSDTVAAQQLKTIFLVYLADDLERTKDVARGTELIGAIKNYHILPTKAVQEINARALKAITSRFNKGNMAPNFEVLDTAGHTIRLADLKGKRLIIDLAAAWCGPCIAAIPEWNKEVEANKDPETVYIYLSLDNTQEESMILFKGHQPKGKLLFAGAGGFKSKFAQDFDIKILPHQIIIDKNGNLESYYFK